ncbi:MAG: AAA family ATPase [Cytophagaceae bacterium]
MTEYQEKVNEVLEEAGKIVIGQKHLLHRLLIGLFTNGHILLEGMPGLAKTLTVNTLAKILNLNFHRIQFTPDLLPADLVGTMIYNQHKCEFEVKKGPVFANIILADEINRSPAKVQSALLECMQEKQVTIGEETFILDRPFLVLATQNPIEHEGTFPLPEAQIDRFMMKVFLNYPDKATEMQVMRKMSDMSFNYTPKKILNKADIFAIKDIINKITISETLENYILELIFATREPESYGLSDIKDYILFGASPRATINLHLAARANAFLNKRDYVLPEDIKDVAHDVLNHRIILNYEAEADGISSRQIVDSILRKVNITNIR